MELDLREGRTAGLMRAGGRFAEFHEGRIHSCCQMGTMAHMTTCHHCGTQGEGMYDGNVGEPVCKQCATTIRNNAEPDDGDEKFEITPWKEGFS